MAFKCEVCGRDFPTEHGRFVHSGRAHKVTTPTAPATRKPRLPATELKDAPAARPPKATAPPAAETAGTETRRPVGEAVRQLEQIFDTQNELETMASLAHMSDEALAMIEKGIAIIRKVRASIRESVVS